MPGAKMRSIIFLTCLVVALSFFQEAKGNVLGGDLTDEEKAHFKESITPEKRKQLELIQEQLAKLTPAQKAEFEAKLKIKIKEKEDAKRRLTSTTASLSAPVRSSLPPPAESDGAKRTRTRKPKKAASSSSSSEEFTTTRRRRRRTTAAPPDYY